MDFSWRNQHEWNQIERSNPIQSQNLNEGEKNGEIKENMKVIKVVIDLFSISQG